MLEHNQHKRTHSDIQIVKMDEMNDGVCESSFENFPVEVLATLFCYLDEKTKRNGRLVTYRWKRVLDTYFLKFTASLSDRNFETILNAEVKFDAILVRNFRRDIANDEELQSKLKLAAETVIFKQNNLLFYSEKNPSVHPANVIMIIQLNSGMKHLVFEKNTLTNLESPILREICLENLTSLEIHITEDDNIDEKTILRSILEIKMPNLSNININSKINSPIYCANEKQKFYFTLFEVLAKFSATLKILTFINSFGLIPPPTLRVIRLSAPAPPPAPTWQLPSSEMEILKDSLADIKLEEFSFMFPKHEGYSVYTLGFQLLAVQTNLSKLEVNFNPLNQDLFVHVERAIQRCSKTLRNFNIVNQGFSVLPISMIEGILRSLGNCTGLQSLSINGFSFSSLHHLCPVIKIYSLEVNGRFDPSVLLEIAVLFPCLEYLVIFHNDNLETSCHPELATNLITLVRTLPLLERLTWKLQKFDLNFLSQLPQVSVVKVHQFIDYYSVLIKKD
ncbi:unnamed protein product [Allacma fusca]|uniref:F-box domain-containing protein n=1 Tax=Allacma fusca TaxID=39272 RepID=A0A8J2NFS8_9HEXA|nr:unnamed protein product [Allacma fusca]